MRSISFDFVWLINCFGFCDWLTVLFCFCLFFFDQLKSEIFVFFHEYDLKYIISENLKDSKVGRVNSNLGDDIETFARWKINSDFA